jgi:glycine oxidase
LACELHPQWAIELKERTCIDTGYRRCGGLYLASSPGEAAALAAWAGTLLEEKIEVVRLSDAELGELEPGLRPSPGAEHSFLGNQYLLPGESQLRNPRHLKALLAACKGAGVTITPNLPAFVVRSGDSVELRTSGDQLQARQYCFTAGSWTGQLLQRLNVSTGILPIRGQMVQFRCERPPISRIVNIGSRYLVPREDGYLLAGSTEEEVGFNKQTTDEAIRELIAFARELLPALREARIERTWAGLRPGSFDGLPYLDSLPGLKNAFVAAGHFRTGLYLSPATAVVMSQLMLGEQPQIDLSPFRVGR